MTVCKSFCILPDDVFGPRTQPQKKLLLCRLSGVAQRYSPLSPALAEKEDLELQVGFWVLLFFFPGGVTGRNKVWIIWLKAHESHARCDRRYVHYSCLLPPRPTTRHSLHCQQRVQGLGTVAVKSLKIWLGLVLYPKAAKDTSDKKHKHRGHWKGGCSPGAGLFPCFLAQSRQCRLLEAAGGGNWCYT